MGDFPVVVIVGPVIALLVAGFWLLFGRAMMGATDRRYSEYRLGELARRMGLHIVEGDPAMNMMQAQTAHNMRTADQPVGGAVRRLLDSAKETRVHLQGAPYGRPTEFVFYSYTEVADRLAVRFVKHDFECRLSLQLPVNLPAFEIVNRKGMPGLKPKTEWDLPKQSFGERELDAKLRLTSADPRLAAHLAPVVAGLASHKFLHIQGFRSVIQSVCTDDATAFAVTDLVRTQQVLEHMATALAGPIGPVGPR